MNWVCIDMHGLAINILPGKCECLQVIWYAFRIETEVKGEQADHVVLQHNDVYTYCTQVQLHQQNVSCVISSSENHQATTVCTNSVININFSCT